MHVSAVRAVFGVQLPLLCFVVNFTELNFHPVCFQVNLEIIARNATSRWPSLALWQFRIREVISDKNSTLVVVDRTLLNKHIQSLVQKFSEVT